jgi:hypothetical protein
MYCALYFLEDVFFVSEDIGPVVLLSLAYFFSYHGQSAVTGSLAKKGRRWRHLLFY